MGRSSLREALTLLTAFSVHSVPVYVPNSCTSAVYTTGEFTVAWCGPVGVCWRAQLPLRSVLTGVAQLLAALEDQLLQELLHSLLCWLSACGPRIGQNHVANARRRAIRLHPRVRAEIRAAQWYAGHRMLFDCTMPYRQRHCTALVGRELRSNRPHRLRELQAIRHPFPHVGWRRSESSSVRSSRLARSSDA
jgi:hypothetical protein